MTFWQFLNQWWNLPYLVMLGLVGVFFLMQAVGLVAHACRIGARDRRGRRRREPRR